MRIVFTRHAIRRMRERGIGEEAVYEALGEPDELFLDTETGRIVAVKYSTGLCVITEADRDTVRIVTVLRSTSLERLVEKRRTGRWVPWRGKGV